jgi:hypothetical protein
MRKQGTAPSRRMRVRHCERSEYAIAVVEHYAYVTATSDEFRRGCAGSR